MCMGCEWKNSSIISVSNGEELGSWQVDQGFSSFFSSNLRQILMIFQSSGAFFLFLPTVQFLSREYLFNEID